MERARGQSCGTKDGVLVSVRCVPSKDREVVLVENGSSSESVATEGQRA